jgi:hypothetical protein
VTSTGKPRTVGSFSVDVGYIDNPGEVVIHVLASDGSVIRTVPVETPGIPTVTIALPGTAGFVVRTQGSETAGWAIENVSFAGEVVSADTYVAMGDSFQSGEGAYNYDFSGHEQCTAEEAMNGVVPNLAFAAVESYHPNKLGHEMMADRIGD